MDPQGTERRLAAVLIADVVGYSRLMAEDEDATIRTVTAYREEVELHVRQHRGRLVDFTGDSFLAEFRSALEAVRCAVEIQRVLQAMRADLPAERKLQFRMGVHLGDIRVEGERIFGTGVNIAARLEALAEPGGICISGTVHEQVRRTPGLAFQDLGPQQVKNIPDPVRVYRVRSSEPAGPEVETVSLVQAEPSVAVLPFVNMSPDPDQEYFADGMAEEIINALTHVEGLRVISRTSAFSFKGTNADISTIGERLNVSAVVEGSVRKAGNRLRITAQLIDVAGGHHLWSEVYDRSLEDVFQIQDEIARTIVTTIKPKLLGDSAAPLVARRTESQEAYELYLRASERIARVDRWDTRTAIAMLEDATALDPGSADAWARLGTACCQMNFAFEPSARWQEQADRAVRRAFDLDPTNAEARFAHARILWTPQRGFQHRPALLALREALQQQPGLQQVRLWQSIVFIHVGLMDEAREALAEVLSAEPEDAFALNILAQAHWFQGRYDETEALYVRSRAAEPTLVYNHLFVAALKVYQNDLAAAEEDLRAARRLRADVRDDPLLDANEALLWARRGEVDRAEAALSRAMEEKPSLGHIHHTWHHAAAAYAVLGRHDEAIAKLREAAATGLPNYPVFRDDPHLVSLRDEPEMKSLMRDLERDWVEYRREFGSR